MNLLWADVNELISGIGQKKKFNREKHAASIEKTGLKPGNRMYVHLSPDIETAVTVGQRHGRPIVYKVKSGQMYRVGFCFYRSANGVWLTLLVPEIYLERI